MKYLLVIIAFIVTTSLSQATCPDNDDLIHGLNTQRSQFKQGNEVVVGGQNWRVLTATAFKFRPDCRLDSFFNDLACYSGNKKLKFLAIPFGAARKGKALCKYQVYIAGDSRGVYGEITLRGE